VKTQREKYSALGNQIRTEGEEISLDVSEHALQEVGLERTLLEERELDRKFGEVFEFVQNCKPSHERLDEWKHIKDANTLILSKVMLEQDILRKFLVAKTISTWIRYGWRPPDNLLMVLITSAIDEHSIFPGLFEEIKNVMHITDFHLRFSDVYSLLTDSGVPSPSPQMDDYIVEFSQDCEPKSRVSRDTVLKVRSTLKLLSILLPRIEINDENAPEFLLLLSKLAMDGHNELYRDVLLRLLSKLILQISNSDILLWPIVSHQWTESLFSFCKYRIKSSIFLGFLESCKYSIHNPVLMHWASSISFTILQKWDDNCWQLESLLEPQPETLLEWIQTHRLFTKATPSYLDTYTSLRFIRIVLNHDFITSRKVCFSHLESMSTDRRRVQGVSW
jgi:hypothetical protein